MNERLLQYIWQYQYFNRVELETTTGEALQILSPGQFNRNQGPDFLEAKIMIGQHLWVGSLELHVYASHWHIHQHSLDNNYGNVILHVVWIDDDEFPSHGIPTLVVGDRVSKLLLGQYEAWMNGTRFIPCEKSVQLVSSIVLEKWKERLLAEREERKYEYISCLLAKNNNHWEEMFWWLMARYFGGGVNGEAFEELAQSIPYNVVLKHRHDHAQSEALLLGQAGLIGSEQQLKEYRHLAKKYQLPKLNLPFHRLRMRPALFPSARIKKLAILLAREECSFSFVLSCNSVETLKKIFPQNIIINAVVPSIYAFGRQRNEWHEIGRAIELLDQLAPERNSITEQFARLGIDSNTAADTQALIELKTCYCDRRRCLECAIGNSILGGKLKR